MTEKQILGTMLGVFAVVVIDIGLFFWWQSLPDFAVGKPRSQATQREIAADIEYRQNIRRKNNAEERPPVYDEATGLMRPMNASERRAWDNASPEVRQDVLIYSTLRNAGYGHAESIDAVTNRMD